MVCFVRSLNDAWLGEGDDDFADAGLILRSVMEGKWNGHSTVTSVECNERWEDDAIIDPRDDGLPLPEAECSDPRDEGLPGDG